METYKVAIDILGIDGSYRTYEEWKLAISSLPAFTAVRSYRTYEEWKPCIVTLSSCFSKSSYRTYEEWKRWLIVENKQFGCVLTVPMRNGNLTLLVIVIRNE